MKKFACWGPSAIADTVFIDIGALPVSMDPLFLAAHTPSRVAHLEGPSLSDASGGEQQIFESLVADINSHQSNSIIAVVGTPGTGKSHAVRWVNAHLRESDLPIHMLYVPREISNLKDLLKTLVAGLPGTVGNEMLTRVEHAIGSLTEAEVASRLTSAMAEELRWRFSPPSVGGANESEQDRAKRELRDRLLGEFDPEVGRRRNGFADILTVPNVKNHLEREGGTLRRVAASIVGQVAGGDSGVTKFELDDLQPQGTQPDRVVRQFLNSIKFDSDCALRLLQEALEQSLPAFVGLTDGSGETLETLFSDARRLLWQGGPGSRKELVLLFEDLAQFGLIDGALFNQFLIQPDDDHAPVRVVFAITNAKWEERVPEAVQRRVRHRFEVLPIQDVSATDGTELEPIKKFLARYLNLVRLGRTQTLEAWTASPPSAQQGGGWVPNSCTTRNDGKECQFLTECHRGFGAATVEPMGQVGLYPFNEAALVRLVKRMGSTAANPGRLLKSALEEVLFEARPYIESGNYPDKRVEDLFDFESVEGQAALRRGNSGLVGDRVLRTNIVWGNDSVLQNLDILEAFDLPTSGIAEIANGDGDVDGGGRGPTEPGPPTPPAPELKEPLPLLKEVNAWSQSPEGLTEPAIKELRPWLFAAVLDRVELDQDLINLSNGVGKQLLDSVFVPSSFFFPGAYGAAPGRDRIRFEINPSDDTVAMLVGLLWYQNHGHWNMQEGRFRWPRGYKPGSLRRHLESYLDSCAERVRTEILAQRDGSRIRDQVIGLNAISRLCLNNLDDSAQGLPAIGQWSEVEAVAKAALSEVDARNWLANLYAVRQGDSNLPQMIDTVSLDHSTAAALKSPIAALDAISQTSDAFPELKLAAKGLLASIESATSSQSELMTVAIAEIEAFNCGEDIESAIRSALEIGDRARSSRLFRPADGWGAFERACRRALENADTWSACQDAKENTDLQAPSGAVVAQQWSRGVFLLSQDLAVIRNSITETVAFAKLDLAGGESAADLGGQINDLGNKALGYIDSIAGVAD
jgi:hypothetical protein